MSRRFLVTLLGMLAVAGLSGCSNNPTSTSFGTMNIQMTDAPGDFQAVNLVVREVSAQHADGNGGWEVLQSGTRTYDLLQLRNGVFATLGISQLPAGRDRGPGRAGRPPDHGVRDAGCGDRGSGGC